MKKSIQRFWPLFATAVLIGGCVSQPKLTSEQVFNQYPTLSQLSSAYEQASKDGADLLAPQGYAKAGSSLDRALTAARAKNDKGVTKAVADGLGSIDNINQNAQNSRDILAEVLQKRADAYTAGANSLQAREMADLDSELRKTSALLEQGELEKAKQRRPKLLRGYSQLELNSLKQGTIELAKSAISDAKRQGALKRAPQTLAQAEEEMALALSILDADRTQTDKANIHATNARWLAQQSAAITETIKDFDRRDYSKEAIVLWHQQQLKAINASLGGELPFNEPSDRVV
ncbi:MAG: OOP family OmpA-OmpF porin, partial [Motiliproteus sp.]